MVGGLVREVFKIMETSNNVMTKIISLEKKIDDSNTKLPSQAGPDEDVVGSNDHGVLPAPLKDIPDVLEFEKLLKEDFDTSVKFVIIPYYTLY